jgi:hypothetical protein
MTTVYFAGGEDTSFTITGSPPPVPITAAGYFRVGFARLAMNMFGGSGAPTTTAWPLATALVTPMFGSISSFWVHGLNNTENSSLVFVNFTTTAAIMLGLADSGGVGRILVRGTGTAGQLKISTRNAAGTIVDLVTSAAGAMPAAASGAPIKIDLFVNYAVSGQCTLYANGVIIADTGAGINVTTDGATTLAQVFYGACYNAANYNQTWSECIVQDTSTLGCALQTIPPVAAGNTQSWLPNTVGNINPTTINDTNFVATTAANALSEWTVATTLPSGAWIIEAVVQEARVSVGLTGPQHFEWLQRTSDGTDHVTGSVAPTTAFSNFQNILPLNPHTSAAWNAGELINAGIESLT